MKRTVIIRIDVESTGTDEEVLAAIDMLLRQALSPPPMASDTVTYDLGIEVGH